MPKRNYGIDLLKILSILMVLAIHIIGQGGAITTVKPMTSQYNTVWTILAIFSCAVNCFAIVSGYVMYGLKFKLSRIIYLWFQVVFYGVLGNIVFEFLSPDHVSLLDWIKALIPATSNEYWYFTAYFGMFFFIPFMNKLIETINKKQIIYLFMTIILVICCLSTINSDVFYMNRGFSMAWLSFLYLFGAGIKKLDIRTNKRLRHILYIVLFLCFFVQAAAKIIIPYVTTFLFGTVKFSNILNQYVSPFNAIIAICLLIIFSNFKLENKKMIRGVKFLSPLVFGCYLIQVYPVYYYDYLHNMFKFMAYDAPLYMCMSLVWYTAITFAVYIIMDYIRKKIFDVFQVQRVSAFIDRKITRCVSWIYGKCQQIYLYLLGEE